MYSHQRCGVGDEQLRGDSAHGIHRGSLALEKPSWEKQGQTLTLCSSTLNILGSSLTKPLKHFCSCGNSVMQKIIPVYQFAFLWALFLPRECPRGESLLPSACVLRLLLTLCSPSHSQKLSGLLENSSSDVFYRSFYSRMALKVTLP